VKKLVLRLAVGFAGVIGFFGSAHAVCSISATSIVFGTYDVLNATPLDITGSVVYRCGPLDFFIRISLDRGGAPTFATRRMVNGSNQLLYNLFRDAARTIIWGDGTGGTGIYFILNPPNNQDVIVPIYGRIPALQDVTIGNYTNTIIATINF
jgi:spore coat protein U-like protein